MLEFLGWLLVGFVGTTVLLKVLEGGIIRLIEWWDGRGWK